MAWDLSTCVPVWAVLSFPSLPASSCPPLLRPSFHTYIPVGGGEASMVSPSPRGVALQDRLMQCPHMYRPVAADNLLGL